MKHAGNLDKVILRDLYENRRLTDSEIGVQYGLSQTGVSRLRARFSIQTISKSDRTPLPDCLTQRQTSILIGSMLGDGRLRRTGSLTASYSEYHSEAQRAYLDWKSGEWGAFLNRVTASNDKRGYSGACLYTHASRLLRPYWELFYPEGKGDKFFGGLDPKLIDPLALAVWFMDDGGKLEGGYARLSVGPDPKSQKTQVQALKYLGLTGCKLYSHPRGNGRVDHVIVIDGRTDYSKFVDLVSPHLLPCMAYKLDTVPRKSGPAPRDVVTRERVEELLDRGLTGMAIAKILGVPRSSLSRHMKKLGFDALPKGRPSAGSTVSYDLRTASDLIKVLDKGGTDFPAQVLDILLNTTLPELRLSTTQQQREWELLERSRTRVEGATIVSPTPAGSRLANSLFPHMYEAHYHGGPTVWSAWHDPKFLARAIQYQLSQGDPVLPWRIFKALRLIVRAPTNFRPCSAKALVDHFCSAGGIVLDPCAGYGGRAVGVLSAGRQYIGVDPHPKAGDSYWELARVIGRDLRFHNEPFEDVDLGDLLADMILTSPPYFSVERYSPDAKQSWVRYKTWESWVAGFLSPFVKKMWRHLKPGCVAVINTKNVKLSRREYPIADTLLDLATRQGFVLELTMNLPIGRSGKADKSEPIFVLRKPTSLSSDPV